jgi:hypothetical protein
MHAYRGIETLASPVVPQLVGKGKVESVIRSLSPSPRWVHFVI